MEKLEVTLVSYLIKKFFLCSSIQCSLLISTKITPLRNNLSNAISQLEGITLTLGGGLGKCFILRRLQNVMFYASGLYPNVKIKRELTQSNTLICQVFFLVYDVTWLGEMICTPANEPSMCLSPFCSTSAHIYIVIS